MRLKSCTSREGETKGIARPCWWMWLSWVVWLAAVLAPFWKSIPYAPGADFSDIAVAHLPQILYLRRALAVWHTVPLWSPTYYSGYPFYADPLSGLWYFPGWLAVALPLPWGIAATVGLHWLASPWGMYAFLRARGRDAVAAWVGAVAWLGFSKVWAHWGAGHLTLLYAVAWTPWLLWAASRGRRWQRAGVVLALIFLADPRWAAYAGGLWALWALRLAWKTYADRQVAIVAWLRHVALEGGIAAALAALLAVPLLHYTALSTRKAMTFADVFVFSLPWPRLAGLFAPVGGMPEWVTYPGSAALLLAVFAWARGRSRFWGGMAALSLFWALGNHFPVLVWLGRVPGINLLRVPPRGLFLLGFALAVAAAAGVEAWKSEMPRRQGTRRTPGERPHGEVTDQPEQRETTNSTDFAEKHPPISQISTDWVKNTEKHNAHFRFLAALALSWRPWRPKNPRPSVLSASSEAYLPKDKQLHGEDISYSHLGGGRENLLRLTLFTLIIVGVALSVGLGIATKHPTMAMWGGAVWLLAAGMLWAARRFPFACYGWGVLLMVDLLVMAVGLSTPHSWAAEITPPEVLAAVQDTQLFRFYSPSYSLPQSVAAARGWELANGVDPLVLASYADFLARASGVPLEGYSVVLPPLPNGDLRANCDATPSPDMLGLLNVRYVISICPIAHPDLREVAHAEDLWLYRNLRERPRAWVETATGWQPAVAVQWTPNAVTVRASGPGKLVLSEIAYPGWQVSVDGQPVESEVAHEVLRTVPLPAGEHVVVWRFRPWDLYVGLALALVGVVGAWRLPSIRL